MLSLGRLIGLFVIHRNLSDTSHFEQFLVGAGKFLVLTVVTAFMVGALLVGGLFMLYDYFVNAGMTVEASNIAIAAFAIFVTLLLVMAVNAQLQKLQRMLQGLVRRQSPIPSKVTDVAEAFMQGLTSGVRSRRK